MAAQAGLAPTATNGLRMAIEPGRGRTAVPVRSAYLGAVFGIVGLVAVFMFASNVDHLAVHPELYGWTFDYAASDNVDSSCHRADYGLARVTGVEAVAALCTSTVDINGDNVAGWGYLSLHGTIEPEVVQGRAPTGPRDIALGAITLHNLGKHIGDTVQAGTTNAKHDYRIVGTHRARDSRQTHSHSPTAQCSAKRDSTPPLTPTTPTATSSSRFAPGVNRTAIEHRIATNPNSRPRPDAAVPPEVDRLRQIDWFPTTLAVLLAGLALLAVGHALVTAVRRRRRDLALLKTLGFNRRQVRATVAWQATTARNRRPHPRYPRRTRPSAALVWQHVANGVGVSTTAMIPTLALILTIPAVLALVNLIAFSPARSAARTRPAVALPRRITQRHPRSSSSAGSPTKSGADLCDDDGDVVTTAPGQGQLDERVGSRLEVLGRRHQRRDLVVGHLVEEPVGAQREGDRLPRQGGRRPSSSTSGPTPSARVRTPR